jgi:hypothetical protein
LDGYPKEPIDSTEAAAKFIERHDGAFDIEGTNLIDLLRGADTQASADAACKHFDSGPRALDYCPILRQIRRLRRSAEKTEVWPGRRWRQLAKRAQSRSVQDDLVVIRIGGTAD